MEHKPETTDREISMPVITSSVDKIASTMMEYLEAGRLVPGQRLIETELAAQFGVGRNAIREAMQRLAARGVVDLSRHRSAAIRKLDHAELHEVLDVAGAMTGLAASTAARHAHSSPFTGEMTSAVQLLKEAVECQDDELFSKARRQFYRALLLIGGNREIQRLFPAIGMHIIYSQFRSTRMQMIRLADYGLIHDAIYARDPVAAEAISRRHVENIRGEVGRIYKQFSAPSSTA
ncbi:MAG: GntR family transcriptional regulator [Parasphingorhabdus sp.]|uniref:GntR family transcriptional regulator n=1 Tax=Parasphingorhabdus sp. TaxID=2709688 RepID=UPI003003A4BC